MLTMQKVFGHSNPTDAQVDQEFEKRGLCYADLSESIIESEGRFHVHGHISTRSDLAETATKKFMIICSELYA